MHGYDRCGFPIVTQVLKCGVAMGYETCGGVWICACMDLRCDVEYSVCSVESDRGWRENGRSYKIVAEICRRLTLKIYSRVSLYYWPAN